MAASIVSRQIRVLRNARTASAVGLDARRRAAAQMTAAIPSPFEREVIETVKVALQQPLPARLAWFDNVARAMCAAQQRA